MFYYTSNDLLFKDFVSTHLPSLAVRSLSSDTRKITAAPFWGAAGFCLLFEITDQSTLYGIKAMCLALLTATVIAL